MLRWLDTTLQVRFAARAQTTIDGTNEQNAIIKVLILFSDPTKLLLREDEITNRSNIYFVRGFLRFIIPLTISLASKHNGYNTIAL